MIKVAEFTLKDRVDFISTMVPNLKTVAVNKCCYAYSGMDYMHNLPVSTVGEYAPEFQVLLHNSVCVSSESQQST